MRLFTLASTTLALAAIASADVADGDKYKCGPNGTVTAHVSVDAIGNVANVRPPRLNAPKGWFSWAK